VIKLPALLPVYEAFTAAAAELPGQPDTLHAELWVSRQLGVLESAAPDAAAYEAAVSDLAAHLAGALPAPGPAAFLAVLAAYGLTDRPADPWPPVIAGEAWLIQDGTLDGDRICLEYRYRDGGTHALLVRLGPPFEPMVIGDVPGMMAQLRQGVQQEECAVLRIDPGTAAARVGEALTADPGPNAEPYAAFIRHRLAAVR
jgi:hypothetical protein